MNWLSRIVRGRISRRTWWTSSLFLTLLWLAWSLLLDPSNLDPSLLGQGDPSRGSILLTVILLPLAVMITVQRLNDRDQPRWVSLLAALLLGAFGLGGILGYAHLFDVPGAATSVALMGAAAFAVWVFVDNGFLKGTSGANRYGPDPLQPDDAPAGAVPDTGGLKREGTGDGLLGRSGKLWSRDAIAVGFAACLTLALTVPTEGVFGRTPLWLSMFSGLGDFGSMVQIGSNAEAMESVTRSTEALVDEDYEAALRHANHAVELYQSDAGMAFALIQRAQVYQALDRSDEALADAERAATLGPDQLMSHAVLGDLRKERGDIRGAIDAYERAVELSPALSPLSLELAALHEELGDKKSALAAYDAALRYDSDLDFIQFDRAVLLKEFGRLDEALEAYGAAASHYRRERSEEWARRPSEQRWLIRREARALLGRGIIHRDHRRYAEALADYAAAIDADPDFAAIYVQRGWVHEVRGDLGLARADYKRTLELDPEEDWAKEALQILEKPTRRSYAKWADGQAAFQAGDYAGALKAYDAAIVLDPQALAPYLDRGWAHLVEGDDQAALVDSNRALEIDPSSGRALVTRGIAYLRLGRLDEALADLDEAVRLFPDYINARTHRGRVHEQLGNAELARADYEAAARLGYNSRWLQRSLRRVN